MIRLKLHACITSATVSTKIFSVLEPGDAFMYEGTPHLKTADGQAFNIKTGEVFKLRQSYWIDPIEYEISVDTRQRSM